MHNTNLSVPANSQTMFVHSNMLWKHIACVVAVDLIAVCKSFLKCILACCDMSNVCTLGLLLDTK